MSSVTARSRTDGSFAAGTPEANSGAQRLARLRGSGHNDTVILVEHETARKRFGIQVDDVRVHVHERIVTWASRRAHRENHPNFARGSLGARQVFAPILYAALTLLTVAIAPAAADAPMTPEQYYRSVLGRMAALPQPALVSYDAVVRASGATFYVAREPQSGHAEFGFSVGSALGDTTQWWPVVVRTADNTTSVKLPDAYAVTRFPALNATWGGIDSWMRFGMQEAATPAAAIAPVPNAKGSGEEPPVIAVVRSLGAGSYRVRDGGSHACDDGGAGHLFHLSPRDDPLHHPATDVTVDESTQIICTIRFEIQRSDLVERDGYVELHLSAFGPYYMVTRGEISFLAGRKVGHQRIRLFIDYANVAFPQTAPPRAFLAPQPENAP